MSYLENGGARIQFPRTLTTAMQVQLSAGMSGDKLPQ